MKSNLRLAAIPLMLALAACAAEYSKSEAPDTLQVDGAETRLSIAFAHGSDRLAAGEAARLDRIVVAGTIRPAPELEPIAGLRFYQRVHEQLRLRQCDQSRSNGGEPG